MNTEVYMLFGHMSWVRIIFRFVHPYVWAKHITYILAEEAVIDKSARHTVTPWHWGSSSCSLVTAIGDLTAVVA